MYFRFQKILERLKLIKYAINKDYLSTLLANGIFIKAIANNILNAFKF